MELTERNYRALGERLVLGGNDEKRQSRPLPQIPYQPEFDTPGIRTYGTDTTIRRRFEIQLVSRVDAKIDNSELRFLIDGLLLVWAG